MQAELFNRTIQLARRGDIDAADFLFVSAFDSLYGLVLRQVNGVLRAGGLEPEDVIQEVYANAWPKMPGAEFADHAGFVKWLRTIARHYMIDMYRRLRADKRDIRRTVRPATDTTKTGYINLLDRMMSGQRSPSQGAARREALAILAGQMWRLPEDYRQVIRLRFIKGWRVREVAEHLGRSEPAVHMLCHRALKRLHAQMGASSKYLTR